MKAIIKKIARVKKSQAIKKAIAAGAAGYALKYGTINANADLFVNSHQETQSTNNQKIETVHDDSQSLTETGLNNCNSTKVKTGSGAVLAFSKDIPTKTAVQEVRNNSSSPTVPVSPGVAHGFGTQSQVNRPAGAGRVNPGRPIRTPQFRTPHGIVKDQPTTGARPKQTELGASKARQNSQPTKGKGSPKPGPEGSTPTEIDDMTCSVKSHNQEQQLEHGFVEKKNKKRNQHLNRQVEVNGENFEFERYKVEKKTASHGPEFGLESEYGPDGKIIRDRKTGKPRSNQNKENYEKFTDNLEEFIKDAKSERIETQYRKGRENEQDAVGFINRRDRKFVLFNKHTKKYISGWVMNDAQYQEFIKNNNII